MWGSTSSLAVSKRKNRFHEKSERWWSGRSVGASEKRDFFRPWSDLLKRVAGAPRGADRGRNNGKSEAKHPLGATGNMPTRSSAVFWAQEGVHLCHLDRNTGDHGEKPLKNIDFGRAAAARAPFFRGGRGSIFATARLHFREKKKSLFSRKKCAEAPLLVLRMCGSYATGPK